MKYRFALLIVLACICSVLAEAKVKLPSVLSDGMVLQRERPIKIWGTADPGENVVVTFKKKKYTAVADENGKWLVTLPAMKAGGPYELTVNEMTVKDILIGDVWLCSGQSNMELTVARVADMFGRETATYENSMVRYVKTPYGNDLHGPKEDISQMNWTALNPQVAQSYAALPYFFAIEMYNETKVPVGIINSSWGGSSIEAWMSEDALQAFPKNLRERDIYNSDEYKALMNKAGGMMSRFWSLSLYKGDEGLHAPVKWYEPELNDSDWEEVNMFSYQLGSKDGYPVSGSHWFRQNIRLTAEQADKDAILRLGCMVNADSVYVNGVFVGTTSYQYPPRIYKVPASVLKAGENLVTVRLINSGGRPSFVKGKPYCMAIDGDTVRLSEQWKYRLGCEMPAGRGGVSFQNIPTGMQPVESGWAGMREAQRQVTLKLPNTSLVVAIDLGEWNDIHPLNKKELARRVALQVKKKVYGHKDIVHSGPLCTAAAIEGGKVILSFEAGTDDLMPVAQLKGFALAGTDGRYKWAEATVEGNKVIVWSEGIAQPTKVRYAWDDNPQEANLKNKAGLPASPFQMDVP